MGKQMEIWWWSHDATVCGLGKSWSWLQMLRDHKIWSACQMGSVVEELRELQVLPVTAAWKIFCWCGHCDCTGRQQGRFTGTFSYTYLETEAGFDASMPNRTRFDSPLGVFGTGRFGYTDRWFESCLPLVRPSGDLGRWTPRL